MGQAKQRGTFEERKHQGETRNRERLERLERERLIREANMTPEQRRSRHHMRAFISTTLGLSASFLPSQRIRW